MTRISKQKLERVAWQKVHKQFESTLLVLKNNKLGHSFLSDILTDTEAVMLSKRLAMLFLLLEEVPLRRIADTLKMSTSTILLSAKLLDRGGFPAVQTFFRSKKHCEDFWKEIEVAIRFGMPSMGKDRWAWLDDLDRKYQTKALHHKR